MSLSLHHHPPPTTHVFLHHAWTNACPLFTGFKEPQHLPVAEALDDILEDLSQTHGTGPASPSRAVIKLTPTLQDTLKSPRWNFSDTAIADFRVVLRSYLQMHGRPTAGPGRQRRYMPLVVSDSWVLTAAPHYAFQRINEAQRLEAAAAEVERRAVSAMTYTAKRRWYSQGGSQSSPVTNRGVISRA